MNTTQDERNAMHVVVDVAFASSAKETGAPDILVNPSLLIRLLDDADHCAEKTDTRRRMRVTHAELRELTDATEGYDDGKCEHPVMEIGDWLWRRILHDLHTLHGLPQCIIEGPERRDEE